MIILRLLPVIVSFLLLAAHFSRVDLLSLVTLSLLIPFLLFIKKRWIARIMQIVLLAGAFEWIRIMIYYIGIRKSQGDDWTMLAMILSVVAIFTVASGFVFQSRHLKKVYK